MNMRFVLILSFFLSVVCTAQTKIESPHLVGSGSSTKLIVNNKPFIILGGELGNSSASSTEYLAPMWSKFTKMNLNTVIAPVYWELMEPSEGKFDFTLVDELIDSARKHHLKLVLL